MSKLKSVFYILIALTVFTDFFVSRKDAFFIWEKIPGFYILFGLAACIMVVFIAKSLGGKWLYKGEDYYG